MIIMNMKKIIASILCLTLFLSLVACGDTGTQPSDVHDTFYIEGYNVGYKEGYDAGYADGYNIGYKENYDAGHTDGVSDQNNQPESKENRYARFSGAFTATVEQLLPDYYALPGKTIAVVHFFQDKPFLLHFQEDLTDQLVEGQTYVFEFEPFEVQISDDEEYPSISNYMYSINVNDYRIAEEGEMGLDSKLEDVEIVSR